MSCNDSLQSSTHSEASSRRSSLCSTCSNNSFRSSLSSLTSRLERKLSLGNVCFDEDNNSVLSFEKVDNVEEIWYNNDEYSSIKREIKGIFKRRKAGSLQETEDCTFYGLEPYTRARQRQSQVDRRQMYEKIVSEATKQRQML